MDIPQLGLGSGLIPRRQVSGGSATKQPVKTSFPSFGVMASLLGNIMNPTNVPQAIGRKVVGNLAENLDPYSYNVPSEEGGGTVDWIKRAALAVMGNKEKSRIETERLAKEGVNTFGQKSDEPKTRIDLLNLWAGKPQVHNTLEESKYRPSIGDEPDNKYLSSKSIENDIVNNMFTTETGKKLLSVGIKNTDDLQKLVSTLTSTAKGKGGTVVKVPSLGDATIGVGKDDNGHYLSYSDKWDIDPTSGSYSNSQSGKFTPLANKMSKMGMVTPPRVYGRIYFDSKGKPIL